MTTSDWREFLQQYNHEILAAEDEFDRKDRGNRTGRRSRRWAMAGPSSRCSGPLPWMTTSPSVERLRALVKFDELRAIEPLLLFARQCGALHSRRPFAKLVMDVSSLALRVLKC